MTLHDPSTGEWAAIGDRIRAARKAAHISVRELARRVEVSPSHVSQVERGLASFSVRSLYNVVNELGVSMDSLFDDSPAIRAVHAVDQAKNSFDGSDDGIAAGAIDPLEQDALVLRAGQRPTIPLAGGTRWERLTPRPESGAEFIEVVYPPALPHQDRPADFIQHSSREYGLILTGTLTVQVGFNTTRLHEGDSIAFDSVTPHRFWNETPEEVRAVWFIWDNAQQNTDGTPRPYPHMVVPQAH